ncbi:MAG TPA: hypothetical protein VNF68_15430 [Candidatus Baltobacteraceae bacterium]|nr:hypothetical protein [Candidatus Baltobacteraceae bacterium]
MAFESVLYGPDADTGQRDTAPAYFDDLHLDQIVETITSGFEEHHLERFFYTPLNSVQAVEYRHEVMRDLADDNTFDSILSFTAQMRVVRDQVARADKLHYDYQKQRWFLQAVETYCSAMTSFGAALSALRLRSRGLLGLRDYVASYLSSGSFHALSAAAHTQRSNLDSIRYSVFIKGNRVTVGRYEEAPDYSAEVTDAFKKFERGADTEYEFSLRDYPEMNHVEANILDLVAALNPETFAALDDFYTTYREFADRIVIRFDREIHFYLAYKKVVADLDAMDLAFCYPAISLAEKATHSLSSFDLALAITMRKAGKTVVCNDWYLTGRERIIVVSGPNQGGKTTFARTFGQLHHLAALGCPVPGTEAKLLLFDEIFTHFERGENLADRRGKLQDDLLRVHAILARATTRSVVIINEIFSSTTLLDALFLARKVMELLIDLDALCVCVTFLDELGSLGEQTVSMTSMVAPDDFAKRTFQILRRPADGRAYALSIAEKHGLTYQQLKARIPS